MARNRQHEVREAADEGVKAAEEIGVNILTLSARAAEQSVNGFRGCWAWDRTPRM